MYKVAYLKTFFDSMVLPYIVPDGTDVQPGSYFVVSSKFGEDLGYSMSCVKSMDPNAVGPAKRNHTEHASNTDIDDIVIDDASILEDKQEHMPIEIETNKILRAATDEEIRERERFSKEEIKAYESAKKEIELLNLPMKLINVHFLLQKKKIIFNFTADNRIDFRQLVKKLASIFRTRIEMRQIGVRDAAKIQGGYGVCGECTCCIRSNCHMNSIFLKMAKDQGFVVNSSKLTGLCGRLMCCLAYENDFYIEERKHFPEVGSFVRDDQFEYKIFSVNILCDEIYASDTYHHQRKFSHNDIQFLKKDENGFAHYRLKAQTPEVQQQTV